MTAIYPCMALLALIYPQFYNWKATVNELPIDL